MSRWLSYLLKPLKWLLFINLPFLPFTFVPYFGGAIDGLLYTIQAVEMGSRAQAHYTSNLKTVSYLKYFALPGAPDPLDTPLAPFHVVELRSPDQWWKRAGLGRLSKYAGTPKEENEPVEALTSLDNLYHSLKDDEVREPFHHFIYLSDSVLPGDEGFWFSDWDKAFNELLKHHYAEPAVGNARFTWMNCRRSFLCDTWRARGPALLHLTTETPSVHLRDEELEQALAARPRTSKNIPLTARLIEFQAAMSNEAIQRIIMPGTFPSPYEQMLAITGSPDNWEFFPVYSHFAQTLVWFGEYCQGLERKYPATYGRISEAETWIREKYEPEGIPLVVNLHFLAYIAVAGPLTLATPLFSSAWHLVSLFLGTSVEDRMMREAYAAAEWRENRLAKDDGEDEVLKAGMLAGFIKNQGSEFEKMVSDSVEARKLLADMWKGVGVKVPAEGGGDQGAEEPIEKPGQEGERIKAA